MLSTLILITLMPLEVSPTGKSLVPLNKPLAVAAFIDSAKILGLPKFKLRDSNGNVHAQYRVMMHEPYAMVQQHAGMPIFSDAISRKTFINACVRGK